MYNKKREYVCVRVDNAQYLLSIDGVQEFLPLPKIYETQEGLGDILGFVSWRGQMIPTIHLGMRLQVKSGIKLSLNSYLIVLAKGFYSIGVIVDEVMDIFDMEERGLEPQPSIPGMGEELGYLFSGFMRMGEEIVPVISEESLLNFSTDFLALLSEISNQEGSFRGVLASLEAYSGEILERRTESIQNQLSQDEETGDASFAVCRIGEMRYGVSTDEIESFVGVVEPSFVAKAMIRGHGECWNYNYRGNLIPLISLEGKGRGKSLVIMEMSSWGMFGLWVDEIASIVAVKGKEILNLPGKYGMQSVLIGDIIVPIIDFNRFLSEYIGANHG